jgi:hypothetical protein
MNTTKTLRDLASEQEIAYLIKNDLIIEKYVDEAPEMIKGLSDGTNEIYYNDGLIVTIYPNVEPSAEWEGFESSN